MTNTLSATETPGEARPALRLIDSDVHISPPAGLFSIGEYLPRAWRERFELKARGSTMPGSGPTQPLRHGHPTSSNGARPDTVSPQGGPGGSDPEFVKADYLDRWDVDCAILSSVDPAAFAAAFAGPDESAVICEAFNRYFIEHWLPVDRRYRYVVCVTPQDIEAAVAELRRTAHEPGVVGVYLPAINVLFGNRHFHPLYRAIEEYDLPIFSHLTGVDMILQGAAVPAGGMIESWSERRAVAAQMCMSSIASLVFSGTLERFSRLRFCFAEFGFTWVLPLLWKMDETWQVGRIDTPWVKRSPTEYVHDHMRFATQPLESPANPRHLEQLIDMLGTDLLLYSSDYPHWDTDNPQRVLRQLSPEARADIFHNNPKSFWRL